MKPDQARNCASQSSPSSTGRPGPQGSRDGLLPAAKGIAGKDHSWCKEQGVYAGIPATIVLTSADADAGANFLPPVASQEHLAARSTDLMSRVDEQVRLTPIEFATVEC